MLKRGTEIGGYVVDKTLGQGSVAVVYRVRHRKRGTIHALKVLLVQQVVARERMILEGTIQQQLNHPNVVRVTEILRLPHGIGLIMDYIAGPTLQAWLERCEPEPQEALRLFAGMVRGVAALHERGVVHRDIKPANFLLDGDAHAPTPKLSDLGIIKVVDHLHTDRPLTMSGAFLGSPAYMAPEQASDPRRVDRRSDLWSLGCVLYELLFHRRAFPGADPLEIANRVRQGAYEPLGPTEAELPAEVVSALKDLLQPDPLDRIQSCAELWQRLQGDRRWGPLHLPPGASAPDTPDLPPTGITFVLNRSAARLPRTLRPTGPTAVVTGVSLAALVLALLWWVS